MATDGFQVTDGLVEKDRCEDLAAQLDVALDGRAGVRHLALHPSVAALARDPRLLGLASAALGRPATPYRATLIAKRREANWLITWHQDTALPMAARFEAPGWGPWSTKRGVLYAHAPAWALERVIALRVYLDDSNGSNGPLRVVPGSHRAGVLSDDAVLAAAHAGTAVACLVPRGGVLAMSPLLLHASSKATDPAPRRVLHLEYAVSFALAPGIGLAIA